MPSYLASTDPEEPIEIPGTGGKTVTFKACASYEAELACDIAAVHGGQTPEERWGAYVLARTVQMIAEWTLEDRYGNPLPISADSLRALTAKVGRFLGDGAKERFDGREEEAERPFESPSPPLSVAAP